MSHDWQKPLKDDHQQVLFLARVCKRRHTQPQGVPRTAPEKVVFVRGYFETLLQRHFKIEEDILVGAIRGKSANVDQLADEIISEHRLMYDMLASFQEGEGLSQRLEVFGEFVEGHVYKEELELFPLIPTILTDQQLNDLKEAILAFEVDHEN